ncbi:MAG: hypothetical protein BWY97_00050 [Tenericutes bacterium ADurb.BinA124]|nr:MAG: hypothetical protein BWY97_00050 [Tenericutes bacterium ADurb.BinA124]
MKKSKRERIIKEICRIRGFWVPDLSKYSMRELKKELKLRTKIRDGKIILF